MGTLRLAHLGAVSAAPAGAILLAGAIVAAAPAAPGAGSDPEVAGEEGALRCLLEPLEIEPLPCASAILVEARTGAVLYAQSAEEIRPPASLAKMMLQLVVLRGLEGGLVRLEDSVATSANASTMGGSQVFLKEGEKQTLHALLQAIAISSANDAAMAVAEYLARSEEAFVARMNEEARRIGCTSTRFVNVHGLDLRWQERNRTSARDLAMIARELLRYPLALELSSTWRAPFRGGEFWLDNTNKMLRSYEGMDGLKTGYTPRAGGCFCGTAQREGVRLLAVVMGARAGGARFEITRRLLDAGFARRPRWFEMARRGESLAPLGPVPVRGSPAGSVRAVCASRLNVLVEEERRLHLSRKFHVLPGLCAPLPEGQLLGYLDCRIEGRTFARLPALAAEGIPRARRGLRALLRGGPSG